MNENPNQITEAVIVMASINTKTGGKPKFTSVNIPIGINKPHSQETYRYVIFAVQFVSVFKVSECSLTKVGELYVHLQVFSEKLSNNPVFH